MTLTIVRTEDFPSDRYLERDILGLNLLPDDYPRAQDPRVRFLRRLSADLTVSGLTGNLRDYADDPEELFAFYEREFERVRIGVYGGDFYDSNDWDNFSPVLFPRIGPEFFDAELPPDPVEDANVSFVILYSDALALFVDPKTDKYLEKVREVLGAPFESQDATIEKLTKLFEIIILTGADGDHFECFCEDAKSFDLLEDALRQTVTEIETSEWFLANRDNLAWDDELSGCLVPEPRL